MSQPEATVPTMSKMPISASREADVVSGIPWSCAAGMKCVPISPFVDQPQIQNDRNSAQNVQRPAGLAQLVSDSLAGGGAVAAAGGSCGGRGAERHHPDVLGPVPQQHQHQKGRAAATTDRH